MPLRFLAIKLLENDQYFFEEVRKKNPEFIKIVRKGQQKLEECRARTSDVVISSERHHLSMDIYESVVTITKPRMELKSYLDNIFMHPVLGYISLIAILYLFFNFVFYLGNLLEEPLLDFFYQFLPLIEEKLGHNLLLFNIISGIIQGIAGGIAIVLPYLFPFLLGLAFWKMWDIYPELHF